MAQVMQVLPHVGGAAPTQEEVRLQEVHEQAELIGSGDEESDAKHQGNIARSAPTNPDGSKIGRNEPCFCGSGKKFKRCHGR